MASGLGATNIKKGGEAAHSSIQEMYQKQLACPKVWLTAAWHARKAPARSNSSPLMFLDDSQVSHSKVRCGVHIEGVYSREGRAGGSSLLLTLTGKHCL